METEFEIELRVFGKEVESCSKFLYEHLSINVFLLNNKSALEAVNASPEFWTTTSDALFTAFFITLGRVFDKRKDSHSIFRMLDLAHKNKNIFSKNAFAERRKKQCSNAQEYLEEYLKSVYEPSDKNFEELKEEVRQCGTRYEKLYKEKRHKFFAHKQLPKTNGRYEVNSETNACDSQKLICRLSSLHEVLCLLFENGIKPDLYQREPRERKFIQKSTRYWMEKLLCISVASGVSY